MWTDFPLGKITQREKTKRKNGKCPKLNSSASRRAFIERRKTMRKLKMSQIKIHQILL
jgi:hypothetical protein